MRKPNYRFERAERDRAKKARNEKKLQRQQERAAPRADNGTPEPTVEASRAKPDRRPPVSRSAALISRLRLRRKAGRGTNQPLSPFHEWHFGRAFVAQPLPACRLRFCGSRQFSGMSFWVL